jgi:hypothetical protein
VDSANKEFNVFHVVEAKGSPYIPAQERFVEPYAIRSVLGCGGALPGGLFALILFAKTSIPGETARLFQTLPLSVKLSLLPFAGKAVFAP